MATLSGSVRLQYFFDVSEEIAVEDLRERLNLEKGGREPGFRHLAPGYVRFEKSPVEERLAAVIAPSGESFAARARYFEYGVVSVELELPFQGVGWNDLVGLASKWIAAPALESVAGDVLKKQLERIAPCMRKPSERQLTDDYAVIEVRLAAGEDGKEINASQLVEQYGAQIAQIVRGEASPLSASERQEVLASSMSYAPTDLMVVGWTAAFVYDTSPESAQVTIQLLEYANTQLLEFRHYDEVLTRVLTDVYAIMDRKSGSLWRMGLAREAHRLNTYRLDVMELAERADNAIKFLSDMFYARAYKLASARIGVDDYRRLVDEKMRAAGELYRSLMDELHQGRAFVLELMIVIILIIDLVFLFRGKT
jgi:hypothetical protein